MVGGQGGGHLAKIVAGAERDAFAGQDGAGDLFGGLLQLIAGLPGKAVGQSACRAQFFVRQPQEGAGAIGYWPRS